MRAPREAGTRDQLSTSCARDTSSLVRARPVSLAPNTCAVGLSPVPLRKQMRARGRLTKVTCDTIIADRQCPQAAVGLNHGKANFSRQLQVRANQVSGPARPERRHYQVQLHRVLEASVVE